jgi:hypothetical protein
MAILFADVLGLQRVCPRSWPLLARIPLGWNHPSDKNTRRFNELEHALERFKRSGCAVRVKKTRQYKNREPFSIESELAAEHRAARRPDLPNKKPDTLARRSGSG